MRRRLGDLAEFKSGGTPAKSDAAFWNGHIPWLTPKDMARFDGTTANRVTEQALGNGTRLAPSGTIFVAVRGMSLHKEIRIVQATQSMAFNQDVKAVIPKGVDCRFLFFALTARKSELLGYVEAAGHGTGVLPTNRLLNLELEIPSPSEQMAIGKLFGAIADKIDLNQRTNETLAAVAQSIFKDWFIDFGPTRTIALGGAPYLTSSVWKFFPSRMDGAGYPEDWRFGRLDDLFVLQRGFDLPAGERIVGKYPVLAASGPSGTHNVHMVRGPGVTTGRSGVLGKVFFVHDDFWPLNTSLWVKEFKNSSPAHAFFVLRSIDLGTYNAGSAVPTLNRNHVHGLPFAIPPMGLIQEFDGLVMPLFERQFKNDIETKTLAGLRDLLLPRLMSGELRVKEAERMIEAVA